MNPSTLSDTEIFTIIDREISLGDLDPGCKAEAEQDSKGNYDLMISRYFLVRIEQLKNQKAENTNRSSALEERKIASANQHLVRYRVNQAALENKQNNIKKSRNKIMYISGNILLTLSSLSAISAIMILLGHTIHTLPYLMILGGVALSLFIPYLFSKISFKSCMISYQTTLTALCIFTCLGSAASGVFLMKMDPPAYNSQEQLAGQNEQAQERSVEISLKPAKSASSVVTNP